MTITENVLNNIRTSGDFRRFFSAEWYTSIKRSAAFFSPHTMREGNKYIDTYNKRGRFVYSETASLFYRIEKVAIIVLFSSSEFGFITVMPYSPGGLSFKVIRYELCPYFFPVKFR